MLKVNNKNTRTTSLTNFVHIENFEHISPPFLVFLLLTLKTDFFFYFSPFSNFVETPLYFLKRKGKISPSLFGPFYNTGKIIQFSQIGGSLIRNFFHHIHFSNQLLKQKKKISRLFS